ncbi:MAG: STAS domain-containing protein [Acidimicrobiia bacterium]|jgi:anti-sigma B factor antagonist
MPQAQITLSVREAGDTARVIDIVGEITAFCEAVLTEAYTEASAPGVKTVVLNFEGLEYMNSGGIGLLVTMLIRAQRNGQALAAYGLSEHYREIFSLTRLDEAIGIHDSEQAALAA